MIYMLCTSLDFVQVATRTKFGPDKLQLIQAPYLSDEQCILMNLYFKIHPIFMTDKFTIKYTSLMRK